MLLLGFIIRSVPSVRDFFILCILYSDLNLILHLSLIAYHTICCVCHLIRMQSLNRTHFTSLRCVCLYICKTCVLQYNLCRQFLAVYSATYNLVVAISSVLCGAEQVQIVWQNEWLFLARDKEVASQRRYFQGSLPYVRSIFFFRCCCCVCTSCLYYYCIVLKCTYLKSMSALLCFIHRNQIFLLFFLFILLKAYARFYAYRVDDTSDLHTHFSREM